ncbi:hypothetical protein ISCGN_032392 [Ixodes scapularis]
MTIMILFTTVVQLTNLPQPTTVIHLTNLPRPTALPQPQPVQLKNLTQPTTVPQANDRALSGDRGPIHDQSSANSTNADLALDGSAEREELIRISSSSRRNDLCTPMASELSYQGGAL